MSTPVTSPHPRASAAGERLNLNPAAWDVLTNAEVSLAVALAAVLGY
jgi:hypothetical protein